MQQRLFIAKQLVTIAKTLVESTLSQYEYPEFGARLKIALNPEGCEVLTNMLESTQKTNRLIFFEDPDAATAKDIVFEPNADYEFYLMSKPLLPSQDKEEILNSYEEKHIFQWTPELHKKFVAKCQK